MTLDEIPWEEPVDDGSLWKYAHVVTDDGYISIWMRANSTPFYDLVYRYKNNKVTETWRRLDPLQAQCILIELTGNQRGNNDPHSAA
ncbi:MAG TPA: hypothetical protein VKT73_15270 [Xanthobacteraceae bacterium]|nr:hypothetical protein [Xanthobacteraceae bacterium]